jgi:hypothetical protein
MRRFIGFEKSDLPQAAFHRRIEDNQSKMVQGEYYVGGVAFYVAVRRYSLFVCCQAVGVTPATLMKT